MLLLKIHIYIMYAKSAYDNMHVSKMNNALWYGNNEKVSLLTNYLTSHNNGY